jgi:CheY-like chemotaxis protein
MNENPRVLWADDDVNGLLSPIRCMLERKGLSVVTATDLASAEHLLTAERFDAVILDFMLPTGLPGRRYSFGGPDLLRSLNRTPNAQTPIVGLSALSYDEVGSEDASRFAAYFSKMNLLDPGAEGLDGLVARIKQLREATILNPTQ